eukprot:scaffold186530_cov26-Prasinocladus_malaysianus.AAC.1
MGWKDRKRMKYRRAKRNRMDWNTLSCDELGSNEVQTSKKRKKNGKKHGKEMRCDALEWSETKAGGMRWAVRRGVVMGGAIKVHGMNRSELVVKRKFRKERSEMKSESMKRSPTAEVVGRGQIGINWKDIG